MKRVLSLLMTAMILSLVCIPSALAADSGVPHASPAKRVAWGTEEQGSERSFRRQAETELSGLCDDVAACYPTSVTRSEDGTEIRKVYDLGPEEDPAGIPRSDFQQDGVRYTLVDLLKQELPENESRQHVETVTLESKNKDMASVLELLPQQREFVTDDGLSGVLTLQLDTVQVDVSGYGSSTRAVNVTRSYPNLAGQDTSYIPKTIQDGGRTLTLQDISWQTDNTASLDGYAMGDRFTAVATYSGSATSSYVKGYTVTANYAGTVSRIALNKTRYVAIFEGDGPTVDIIPTETDPASSGFHFRWAYLLVPLGVIALAGGGMGTALFLKRRHESVEEEA